MTILIINIYNQLDVDNVTVISRGADFIISDGVEPWYFGAKSGLATTGSIQQMLDEQEAQLWTNAQIYGRLATPGEIALAEARAWYLANPGAKADVFDKSVAQLHTDITAMVNASFPNAPAAVKTGWVRTLVSSLLDTRYNALNAGLVNGE